MMNLYNIPNWSNTIAEFNKEDSSIVKPDDIWYIKNSNAVNNPKTVTKGKIRLFETNKSIISIDNPVTITMISGNWL